MPSSGRLKSTTLLQKQNIELAKLVCFASSVPLYIYTHTYIHTYVYSTQTQIHTYTHAYTFSNRTQLSGTLPSTGEGRILLAPLPVPRCTSHFVRLHPRRRPGRSECAIYFILIKWIFFKVLVIDLFLFYFVRLPSNEGRRRRGLGPSDWFGA
jgi:hypothetical protein